MPAPIEYLLLQVRDADDPVRQQEVRCFCDALDCPPECMHVFDLLSGTPSQHVIDSVDAVLIGGSGRYSVVEGGQFLGPALETMAQLVDRGKPTFASCWGFQAMAKALGGEVVTDMQRAELGTPELHLTTAGQCDPIFGPIGATFRASMGHQDIVDRLPAGATLLASSDRVAHEAFCINDKPIYATQFHPELTLDALMHRLEIYPEYVQRIAGTDLQSFKNQCAPTPQANSLLPRFVEHFFS